MEQDALRRLVQNGALTDEDITDLLTICPAEAAGEEVFFVAFPLAALV